MKKLLQKSLFKLYSLFFKKNKTIGLWIANHLKDINPKKRLEIKYQWKSLPKPQYFLGLKRALDLAKKQNITRFSIIEFGVAEGNGILILESYVKALLCGTNNGNFEIKVFGFDTFEGLPEPGVQDAKFWKKGDYPSNKELLESLLDSEITSLFKGFFNKSIPLVRQNLLDYPPLFISVDCDLYQSTKDVMNEIKQVLPNASYWYFDDTRLNFCSEKVGERLAIKEFNEEQNKFELIPDYYANAEPVPAHMPHVKLYYNVSSDYRDMSRPIGIDHIPINIKNYFK